MKPFAVVCALVLPLVAARSDPLDGRIAGPPRQCIGIDRVQAPLVVDGRTILYRQNGGRVWRTGPVGRCPSLRPTASLIVDLAGGQLCRNDRFRTFQPGDIIPGPPCRFDAFTPYDRR